MTAAFTAADALALYQSSSQASGDGLGGSLCPSEFWGWAPMASSHGAGEVRVDAICQRSDVRRLEIDYTAAGSLATLTAVLNDGTEVEGTATALSATADTLLEAGDGLYWARVRRDTSGGATDGVVRVVPVLVFNGPAGHDDGEDLAGTVTQYGCLFVYARQALTLDSLDIGGGLVTGYWLEELAGELETQEIADRLTAPTGATWQTGASSPGVSLGAGEAAALWIRTEMGPGTAAGLHRNLVELGYTVGANSYALEVAGGVRVADTSLACYELYGGDEGASAGGSLLGTGAALPFEVAISAPGAGTVTHRLRVGLRNAHGLRSLERHLGMTVTVNDEGEDATAPSAPTLTGVTDNGGGLVLVRATWRADGGTPGREWRVTATPDIGAAVAYSERFGNGYDAMGRQVLEALLGPFSWGANVTVAVTVADAAGAESGSVGGSVRLTSRTDAVPAAVVGGPRMAVSGRFGRMAMTSWGDVLALTRPGSTVVAVDNTPGLAAIVNIEQEVILTALTLADGLTVADAEGGDPVEVDEHGVVWLCAGGKRACGIDPSAGTLTAAVFAELTASCPEAGPVYSTAESAWWQVWDARLGLWRTWLQVDSDGTVRLGEPLSDEV